MERTVPRAASEEVELYLRTYYSLLRSTTEVKIRTLEEVHAGMNSLLHPHAREDAPDMSAFIYSLLRLPSVMPKVELVVMGQSPEVFAKMGTGDVEAWQRVEAPARRRRCFFDGKNTLACLIASRSDIDDILPLLTAYQIEWNKLNRFLNEFLNDTSLRETIESPVLRSALVEALRIPLEDFERLERIWGEEMAANLENIGKDKRDLRVQLLSGSLADYRRATHEWWNRIEEAAPELKSRPVYFVSSNLHSLVNIASGFALQHKQDLLDYLEGSRDEALNQEWEDIQAKEVASSRENFFYYLLKKYLQTAEGQGLRGGRLRWEETIGIKRIHCEHSIGMDAQVVHLAGLDPHQIDPRLQMDELDLLEQSDAVILNIDYPLGMAAYDVLLEVSEHVGEVLGVYVMGKAATLNGVLGDVMLPNVVYDGQSRNTYLFPNCFNAEDVEPYLVYGNVLDNQKSVTVRGTFLQNATYMDVFYNEGYTVIEMEAGPYLSAVYEMSRPKRHPQDEIVNLYELPFDLGLLHYASDKPLSKGRNLGAASLSYYGMDPTYATTLAILRRVFARECERVRGRILR